MSDITELVKSIEEISKVILAKIGLGDSRLAKNIQVKVKSDGNVEILMPDYAKFIDKGRRPGRMPPVSVISRWISMKKIPIPPGFNAQSFSFAISKNIGKRGLKARPFIETLANNIFEIVFKFTSKKIDNAIKRI